MRIPNDNFIIKHKRCTRGTCLITSPILLRSNLPQFLYSIFVIAFLPELMARKSLDTLISHAKLFAVIIVSRGRERERERERKRETSSSSRLSFIPGEDRVGSSERSDGNETFLLVLYRARGTQSAG